MAELASEKQKDLMSKLGINFVSDISKADAHKLIDEKIQKDGNSAQRELRSGGGGGGFRKEDPMKQKTIIAQTLTKCWAELNVGAKLGPEAVVEVYKKILSSLD